MLCPRCQIEFNAVHWGECPHCGVKPMTASGTGLEGVVKTSTILISTDDGGLFRSLEDVPKLLRAKLTASTSGVNSATIVIADQAGRARMDAALRGLEAPSSMQVAIGAIPAPVAYWRRPSIVWLAFLLVGTAGGLVWFLYTRTV